MNGLDRPFSRTAEDDLAAQVPPVLTSLTPQQAISDKELEMVLNLCHQKVTFRFRPIISLLVR